MKGRRKLLRGEILMKTKVVIFCLKEKKFFLFLARQFVNMKNSSFPALIFPLDREKLRERKRLHVIYLLLFRLRPEIECNFISRCSHSDPLSVLVPQVVSCSGFPSLSHREASHKPNRGEAELFNPQPQFFSLLLAAEHHICMQKHE